MNTIIKATRHQLSDAERELVSEKLGPLSKLLGTGEAAAELAVEVAITAEGEKHGAACRAEANLSTDGRFYRAEASAPTMSGALDAVHQELSRELRSDKGRTRRLMKRGGAALKSMLRLIE
jgi:ribosome-associated translation inhibitor RaiA